VFEGVEDVPPGVERWAEDYGECHLEQGGNNTHRGIVPDTGIVNYYQMKDTLMGHVDRAE
jgi:alkylated DNA repair protein alkB family protein 1